MTDNNINNFLIPNVNKVPGNKKVDLRERLGGENVNKDEFKNLLKEQIDEVQTQHGINLSVHAAKRLQERNLSMDTDEYFKIKGAMDKLRTKGGRDSLVITDKAAYIVDVPSNKVVTAIDKASINDNVFTKIDSTVVV